MRMSFGCVQEKEEVGGRYSKQKMVLGTHTSEGEQNYLMLAEVRASQGIWSSGCTAVGCRAESPAARFV